MFLQAPLHVLVILQESLLAMRNGLCDPRSDNTDICKNSPTTVQLRSMKYFGALLCFCTWGVDRYLSNFCEFLKGKTCTIGPSRITQLVPQEFSGVTEVNSFHQLIP